MRFIRTLLPAALLVALAACGGAATSTDATASEGSSEATASASASAASSATTSASASEGGGSQDLEQLEDELTPPNSSETSRFDVPPNGVVISYQSSTSMDDLRLFYEGKFASLGLEVISTSDAGDSGVAWVFADTTGGTFGGNVTLAPASGSTAVVVTLGQEGD